MLLLRKIVVTVATSLMYVWIGGTALIVLIGSCFTVTEHSNLGLGLVQVQGIAALVTGVSLGVIGLFAIALLWRRSTAGIVLLLSYCAFFVISLGGAVTKDMLASAKGPNSQLGEDLPLLVMIAAFLGSALWARKLIAARRAEIQ